MKIYMASHIKHARRWIDLRPKLYPRVTIVSTWIDFLKDGEVNCTPEVLKESWDNNVKDIIICDILLLYAEPGEPPRGAAFEAGIAYAMGKPILHIGDRPALGTMGCCFEYFETLDQCLKILASEQEIQDVINSRGSTARN